MKKKTKGDDTWTVAVNTLGRAYTATGETFEDAVAALGIRGARGRSIWNVEHKGKSKERVLINTFTHRLFNGAGLTRDVARKNLKALFDI